MHSFEIKLVEIKILKIKQKYSDLLRLPTQMNEMVAIFFQEKEFS